MWEIFVLVFAVFYGIYILNTQKSNTEMDNARIAEHTKQLQNEGVVFSSAYNFRNEQSLSSNSNAIWIRFIVDNINQQIIIADDIQLTHQRIPFDNIIGCDIYTDNEVTGGVKRAIVGGVVSGGVGAIVGAATAKKHIMLYQISIYTNDLTSPMIAIPLIQKKTTTKSWDYHFAIPFAQQVCASIKAIIANQ